MLTNTKAKLQGVRLEIGDLVRLVACWPTVMCNYIVLSYKQMYHGMLRIQKINLDFFLWKNLL